MTRILVFDSGVGGLSILRAIQSHTKIQEKNHQWLFCSDNEYFPYGTKDASDLIERVVRVLTIVCEKYHPDIIVMACNTASTIALDAVRKMINVPVVGVVPAIKPAAKLSQSRSIGLLATPGTLSRSYTRQLIDEFASDCHITGIGSGELVEMIENYLRTGQMDEQKLDAILEPFRKPDIDTIVLACTHFPLIIEILKKHLPSVEYWVDSGEAIANRVVWLLDNMDEQNHDRSHEENIALFTLGEEAVYSLRTILSGFGIDHIDNLDIDSRLSECMR